MKPTPPDPLDAHIGQQLRRMRLQKGLSMEQTAELIEVGQQQISRFELGQNRLSAAQLYRLARGLNVPIAWFFEGYQERPDELGRVKNVVRESRAAWSPMAEGDLAKLLVAYWKDLSTQEQKRKIVDLLESLVMK